MTVVNEGGNKYKLYDEGLGEYVGPEGAVSPDGVAPELSFVPGFTYVFKQEDSSNDTHPLFITTSDTYSSGAHYSEMVETSIGDDGVGRIVTVTIPVDAQPTNLWYLCSVHGVGMGNTSNIVEETSGVVSTPPNDVEVTGAEISIQGASIELSGVGFDEAFKTYMETNYSGGIFYNVNATTVVEIQQSDIMSWDYPPIRQILS